MIKYTILPIVTLAIIAVVLASVFAYYPLTITATPQAPGVVFQAGSNADQPDLGGKTITVLVDANGASASVTINPTYQETYYKDILRVVNNDARAMNVYIVFTSVDNTLPPGSIVKLFFYDGATRVGEEELVITNPGLNTPISIGSIAKDKTWQIDIYVYIPEGTSITDRSYSASAKLVYTPSNEMPPTTPSNGR